MSTNSEARDARAARRSRLSQLRNGDHVMVPALASASTSSQTRDPPGRATRDSPGGESIQDVHEDDVCPICRLLLYNPVTTTCNHTLCRFCMAQWASVSLAEPLTIVDVDEEPVAFDAVSELEARCPMCRTMTIAYPDHQRAGELSSKYPRAWAERDLEAANESEGFEGVQTITVYIGNRHRLVTPSEDDPARNCHEWTFFVRPSRTDVIEEVHIHLHPTFRQNHLIRQLPPYQVTRLGWGVFDVTASVILKPGYSWVSDDARNSPDGAARGMLPLEWTLDFSNFGGKGSMGRRRLKVKNDRGWEGVDDEDERDRRERGRMERQYERDGRYEP